MKTLPKPKIYLKGMATALSAQSDEVVDEIQKLEWRTLRLPPAIVCNQSMQSQRGFLQR